MPQNLTGHDLISYLPSPWDGLSCHHLLCMSVFNVKFHVTAYQRVNPPPTQFKHLLLDVGISSR